MTVKRRKENFLPSVIVHKIADIPGGVSIRTANLGGSYLLDGSLITAPDDKGLCDVLKTGRIIEVVNGTTIKVNKYQNFKVGNLLQKQAGSVYTITKIDSTNAKFDIFTVKETGAFVKGDEGSVFYEATDANGSFIDYPIGVTGTGVELNGENVIVDAVVIGVTHGANIPEDMLVTGIVNY